jgi:hypothetical protein
MNQKELRFHPASEIFPLMEGKELEDFAQDIREHGLREAITLHPDGTILDGRNRYRACVRVGVKPRFTTWKDDGSPVSFVISLNLKRRQLTPSQLGMIALKAKPLLEAEARERQRTGGRPLSTRVDKGTALAAAGDAVGVSDETVRRAEIVTKHGIPDLAAAVKAGSMTVRTAALIATMPHKQQEQVLAGGDESIRRAASRIRRGENQQCSEPPAKPRTPVYPKSTHPSNKAVSEAFTFAEIALSQLSRIRADDPRRIEQLQRVRAWIDTQLVGQKEES